MAMNNPPEEIAPIMIFPTSEDVQIPIKIYTKSKDVAIPRRATTGSAGYDLAANENIMLKSGESARVGTGFSLKIPENYCGHIFSRSGLSFNHGIWVCGGVSVIDSDYHQEVFIPLINVSPDPYEIRRFDRVAQLICRSTPQVDWIPETPHPQPEKGNGKRVGGFGSTGK